MAVTRLYDIANALLDDLVTRIQAQGVTPPDRRYVHPGPATTVARDCLPGHSLVYTPAGPIPIRDLQVGDMVWSWDQGHPSLERVSAKAEKGVRPLYRVRCQNRTVEATADHPLLILGHPDPKTWRCTWKPLRNVHIGDYLIALHGTPDHGDEQTLPDGTALTADVAWLLGLFSADGYAYRGQPAVDICVYGETRQRAKELIKRVWDVDCRESKTNGLSTYSRDLHSAVVGAGFAGYSRERIIPPVIWASPQKIQRAYLSGLRSDAHQVDGNYWAYAAVPEHMMQQARTMHILLGDAVSNISEKTRRKDIVIGGKKLENPRSLWRFQYYPRDVRGYTDLLERRGAGQAFSSSSFRPTRVREIIPIKAAPTFDITVENTENFVADGLIVHNCPQMTIAADFVHRGPPGAEDPTPLSPPCVLQRTFQMTVEIVRCVPTTTAQGRAPAPDAWSLSALEILTDGWALSEATFDAIVAGTVLADEGCDLVAMERLTPFGPEGGIGGVQQVIQAQV